MTEAHEQDLGGPELSVSPETVCFLIIKLREFGAKDQGTDPSPASNPTDDRSISVLEEHADDPVTEEIARTIRGLSRDAQIDLVALLWIGRGDGTLADWDSVRAEAARAHNARTGQYLLGDPLAADFLEEGLTQLGYSCDELDTAHL